MAGSAEGSVTIAFDGAEHSGSWVLGQDGRLTVTHPVLGRRRAAVLNSAPEDLAAPLLLDIVRQAGFPAVPEDRRGKIYADGAAYTTGLAFLGVWAYAAWDHGWLGLLLGWLPAFLIAGVSGFVWPVAAPVLILLLGWRLFS